MSGLIARLIAAGTPADLIEEVAMELARAKVAEEAIDQRRSKDRERQQAHRRNVTSRYAADVTQEASPLSSPPKVPPDPQKITPPLTPQPTTGEKRAREPFPRPEWADPQVWADLLANRRKKNLANTASAHRKLLADIDRLTDADWPPGRVLEAAVSRGWGAIYAGCKDDDDGRTNGKPMGGHQPGSEGLGVTARAAIAVFGPVEQPRYGPGARHQ